MNPLKAPQSLTTEELDALLFQPTQARLAPAQSAELASLRSVLADFRTASIAAADHHHRHASIAPARSRTMIALWAFTAAALLVSVASPMAFHHHPTPIPAIAAIAPQQPAPAVSDEVLLADVQADLDASVPSPMLPLTTNLTTTKSTTQRTR
jgi:hypothetical protein